MRVRVLAAMLVAGLAAGCGGAVSEQPRTSGSQPSSGLRPAVTEAPSRPDGRYLTARLVRTTALRARPAGSARLLTRIARRTEFGSPRVLAVLRRRAGWLEVEAPELPNGHAAWIPADAVEEGGTDLSIHVDRSARELTLRDKHRVVVSMPVAVGRPGNQTPLGRFAVTDRLHTESADSPYGCCAIALTGHQRHLPPGWPGGDRLAIHGTPQTSTIGQAASLGCLRAPARGIRLLMRRIALGTPVFISN
jgi:lipoprotein-anchoring transpeptidase ErfK/SrfK